VCVCRGMQPSLARGLSRVLLCRVCCSALPARSSAP
jgi:hypothetical protein